MRVERCVEKAFKEMEAGDLEFAMLCACLALDGTAYRAGHSKANNKQRFTGFVRNHYDVLQPMGVPQLDVVNSRFERHPALTRPTAGEFPDLADVIYLAHRCSHSHGDEVPVGFELQNGLIGVGVKEDTGLQLPGSIIWGLLAVVILAPVNADLRIAGDRFLTWTPSIEPLPREPVLTMPINEWWGRKDDFVEVAGRYPRSYIVTTPDSPEWQILVEEGAAPIKLAY